MRFFGLFSILAAGLALAAPAPSHQGDLVLRADTSNVTDLSGALVAAKDFRAVLHKELTQICMYTPLPQANEPPADMIVMLAASRAAESSPDVAANLIKAVIPRIATQAQDAIGGILPLVLKLDLPLNGEDTQTLVALAQEVQGVITETRDTVVVLLRGLSPDTIRAIILEIAGPVARTIKNFLGPFGGFVDALIPLAGVASGGLGVLTQALANILGGSN
ncbi:hypothetical protein H9Q69_008336 [Fusarium xylarioides]|uniref:Uncharacterized protein n=1 Tax=Fusarium xylarioides TaxID=221167 RepID=A0A9P7HIT4_9HYPO|nr:hypothetical protein H9Q70_012302 [Fusarium xylarioides]KAG5760508.1 hypothetical protein H9Q72_011379 [Fusarium xylarioides]KAG5773571.1 hypothetical protein H9Q73_012044 [Fusarium xylarioides]KAG5792630.1 hypothetical protein H9Q69_008336 [Fusarium xylarioides]